MDDKLQIALCKRYIDKLEAKIRQDHGDKPFVKVWLQNTWIDAVWEVLHENDEREVNKP